MLSQNLVDYTFLETAFKLLLLVAGPKIQSRPNSGRLLKKVAVAIFLYTISDTKFDGRL